MSKDISIYLETANISNCGAMLRLVGRDKSQRVIMVLPLLEVTTIDSDLSDNSEQYTISVDPN